MSATNIHERRVRAVMKKGRERTSCEEPGRVEVPEDGVAVDEDEDRDPEDAPVRQPGLQAAEVDELLAVEALCLHAAVCKALSAKMSARQHAVWTYRRRRR